MSEGQFHINATGDVHPCKAVKQGCRFGDSNLHFSNPKEARAFVEKLYAEGTYDEVLKGRKLSDEVTEVPEPKPELKSSRRSITFVREFYPKDLTWEKRFPLGRRPTSLRIYQEEYKVLYDRTKSGFLCNGCGRQLTKEEEDVILSLEASDCPCGEENGSPQDQKIGVFADSLWVLNPKKYSSKSLYHLTKKEDWSQALEASPDLRVHVGSLAAAETRRNDKASKTAEEGPWRRYEIKLRSDEDVKIFMSEDLEDNWDSIGEYADFVAYLNRWEDPGSLSVMATGRYLDVGRDSKIY